MQTAMLWRPREGDEFAPVCGGCWGELFTAQQLYAHAVATPGVTLTIQREGS